MVPAKGLVLKGWITARCSSNWYANRAQDKAKAQGQVDSSCNNNNNNNNSSNNTNSRENSKANKPDDDSKKPVLMLFLILA